MPILSLLFMACQAAPTADETAAALRKAATYYRNQVSSHGGYVYYSSLDLKDRWGEGKAGPDTIFVQSPGTPTVGRAFLQAHAGTRESFYLDAARDAAEALVYGQLESGGWTQTVDFAPAKRQGRYRNGKGGSWNASSLDDGQTQSALIFLMRADRALGMKHAAIHEAALYGMNALLQAQFPNGAFPQVWTAPVAAHPVLKAKFPEDERRVKNYWDFYTLNDGLAGTVAEVLVEAHTIYGEARYRAALEKLGDFLILAQMPDPQPGWCQQYDAEMVPIWARKFEPPAVTGWESQDVLETLLKIHRVTGHKRFLEPIPRALEYFKKCLLPDGRVARYYEFRTNRPLYMDAAYRRTYDDSAAPDHYGWKQPSRFDRIEKEFREIASPAAPAKRDLGAAARDALRGLDAEGRWVSLYAGERLVGQPKFAAGFPYLSSAVFARQVEVLSEFLSTTR